MIEVHINQTSRLHKSLDVEVKDNLIINKGIQCKFILYKV